MQEQIEGFLQPGRNCWRIDPANRFTFIHDAADYFQALRRAMLKARHSILMIGWDFDARIALGEAEDGGPKALGDFVLWLAGRTPDLHIRLLRWDTGALASLFRGTTLWTILRWKAHPRITLRLDAAHPLASSHHQKIVVIDESIAFCGGIDMTIQRWDTREHLDDDPRRTGPGRRPHPPWHDAASAFDGEAAAAMGALARARWQAATREVLPEVQPRHDCWPDGLAPTFTDMHLGIARSLPKMPDVEPVHEIERAWVDMILGAQKMIYAENQYFASRRIALALAERLSGEDPPEFVLVTPHGATGWLEPLAMDSARARLVEALTKLDRLGRFRIYHPQTAGGKPIYVHAKVMIVDDHILRVGSSNFNNRSMRLDSECDVILSAYQLGNAHLTDEIAGLRNDLLAEHLACSAQDVASQTRVSGSLIAAIEALRGPGRSLVPFSPPELSSLAEWLADNEILDPNGPDDIFESTAKRGLFKGWDRLRRRLRRGLSRRAERKAQRKAAKAAARLSMRERGKG